MKIVKHYLKALKNAAFKMLKILAIILFCLLYIFADSDFDFESLEDMGINLNPNDYCTLTDVDYTAVLHDDPNGKAHVSITEYLTFDVHAASKNNPFKELWRELPEDNVDGLPVTYTVHSVTQILDNGTEIPYTETPKMFWEDYDYQKNNVRLWHHSKGSGRYPDNDESLLMYIPWTYRDTLKFKIEYDMNNAALKYNDCSELYLSMYSGKTITKLNSFKGQILVPNNIMPKTYYAYSFGTKNSRIPFEESDSSNPGYHTFSFELNKSDLKFQHNDRYIEFCLLAYGDDKHIFTKNAPSNKYTYENVLQECIDENEKYSTLNKRYGTIKFFIFISSLVITVLIIDSSKNKVKKIKEDNTFYKPEIDYEYFRDIPSDLDPIFAADLVFSKDPFDDNNEKQEEYASILLSLTRKKYVTLKKADESSDWSVFNTIIELNVRPEYKDVQAFNPYNRTTNYNNYNDNTPYFTTSESVTNTQTNPIYNQDNANTEINSTNSLEQSSENANVVQGSKIINILEGSIFNEDLEPLTTSEKLYLDLLIRHSKTQNYIITLGKLQNAIDIDYEYSDAFVKNIDKKPALEVGLVQGYYQTATYDKPKKDLLKQAKNCAIVGLIMLTLVNLISFFTPLYFAYGAYTLVGIALLYRAFYFNIKSKDLLLLTQFGEDERAKWYGLYKFLDSETLINEKEVHDLVIWEKYLIYATAFGISEKVIKAIKLRAPEINIDRSPILSRNSYIHSRNFHSTSKSFGHSIHTVSHGGHGGHFGYGGGGRGGGGGGGGH